MLNKLDIIDLKNNIKDKLALPLLNKESHKKMMPDTVEHYIQKLKHNSLPIESSVLIILCEYESKVSVVLTKRAIDNRSKHSGQISFPGGKKEVIDRDNAQTALREAKEEINVNIEQVELLGQLSELYIPVSNFVVYPFVCYYKGNPLFEGDQEEVAEIIFGELEPLLNESNVKYSEMHLDNIDFRIPYYDVSGHVVWGATAMILSEFIDVVNSDNRIGEKGAKI